MPFAAARFDGAFVRLPQNLFGHVYILGYRAADNTTSGEVWYYNVANSSWVDTGTQMPVPISNYTATVLTTPRGVGIYTFGGRDANGKSINTVQVYYPRTNVAQTINSDPWPGVTPSACVSIPATGVTVVNNKAYVLGGMSFSTSVPPCSDENSAQVWRFDPNATAGFRWTSQPSLTVARGYVSAAAVGNKIYAIGGDINSAGTLTAQTTVESWVVGSSSWSATPADLPQACDESQAFALPNSGSPTTITLAGCGQWPNALPDVFQYTVSSDTWAAAGSLNEARRNQAGAIIGSPPNPVLFVAGGYNSDGSATLSSSEMGS